ncbi:MAG: aldehyde dehydrogenase family protein, partial [Sphingomonadaceae bacterium]|nr:aldehyde dehydrogenase family protein [Sphingomonadaceae bacterium]
MTSELVSIEPATGAELWRGAVSDVAAEVAAAQAAQSQWAAQPVADRIALVTRFAEIVRDRHEDMATLIARETGKPLWETRTEVDAVINKVAISVKAYDDRTPEREVAAAAGQRTWLRHKPHGVMAVLGPYNFPAHLPNGHIIPALIAGNAIVFKPSEKTPATGAFLVECLHA